MTVRHWTRDRAIDLVGPGDLEELDEVDLLVIDELDASDEEHLSWCRLAPCVVAAVGDDDQGPDAVDVVVPGAEEKHLELVVEANPQAARTLVDVLRTVADIPVTEGLIVESLAYSMLLGAEEFRSWLAANPRPEPKTFTRPAVSMTREGENLRITLDHPENRNAHSAEMRDAICEGFDLVTIEPTIREVTLEATGPVFSSGGDLSEFGTATDLVRAHQIRTLRSVGARIASLDAQTRVRVKGACVGAGVEIPAFADRVVAAADTTFRLPEVGMGLIPGAGGTVSLTKRIGRQRTARLALMGEAIDVHTALRWGLVDEVV